MNTRYNVAFFLVMVLFACCAFCSCNLDNAGLLAENLRPVALVGGVCGILGMLLLTVDFANVAKKLKHYNFTA